MVEVVHRLPGAEEHRQLAEAVGWHHAFDWAHLPESLARSIFGAVALDSDLVVGMGRVVGDGVMYFYVQDIAVLPEYQRQGIGERIVAALLEQIAPRGPAFVGLFATPEGMALYERAGFTSGDMEGLFQVISRASPDRDGG